MIWLLALLMLAAPPPLRAEAPVQDPTPPHAVREVRFPNAGAGIELAGTLTTPPGPGPFPAVVLISGAGPQDRDSTLWGHRTFAVLADHLSRRGVAVLRFDDRGVGGSSGDFAAATLHDFAGDARAALDFLRTQPGIDPGRTGLAGHSEGGLVAPLTAVEAPPGEAAFLVLLATPGVDGEQTYYLQDATEARVAGADEAHIARMRRRKEQMFAVVKAEPDPARAAERLRQVMRGFELTPGERADIAAQGVDLERMIDQQIQLLNNDATRVFLVHDPLPTLRRLSIPVLVLTGERDLQAPPGPNLPLVEAALARPGGCPRSEVRELPGLNHLFQTAETGLPRDYAGIQETMAPAALEAVADWILEQDGRPCGPAG